MKKSNFSKAFRLTHTYGLILIAGIFLLFYLNDSGWTGANLVKLVFFSWIMTYAGIFTFLEAREAFTWLFKG